MKAVVKLGNNYGELEIREIPIPEIDEDDILVKVMAAGICGSDLNYYKGKSLRTPVVLGHEFAGVVEAVGARVKDWTVGERIVSDNTGYACGKCYSCATGQFLECDHRITIGYGMDGGFAEYVRIPGDILRLNPNAVFKIPSELSFEAASMLDPCANAYQALIQKSSFKAGDDVVIFGPGTIGLLCVQIAKAAGADKIVVLGTKNSANGRFALAKQFGATHTVVSTDEDAIAQVKEVLHGVSPRIIIDCAGSPAVFQQALLMVAKGGEIVKIGFDHQVLDDTLNTLVLRGVKLIGNFGYNSISWRNCIKLMQNGRIKTDGIITHRLPLSDFNEGFHLLFEKEAIKVILNP